ncbi:hypothetical protein Tco_0684577 [Tanacetum coccineum]
MVDGVEDREGVFTPPTNDPPNVFGGVTTEKDMLIGFHHTITRRTRDDRDFYTSTGKVKAMLDHAQSFRHQARRRIEYTAVTQSSDRLQTCEPLKDANAPSLSRKPKTLSVSTLILRGLCRAATHWRFYIRTPRLQ